MFSFCILLSFNSFFCIIQIIDIERRDISNVFCPTRKADGTKGSRESPVTKMFLSADGQWLAAVNCFGDIYVFNLEVQRYTPVCYSSTCIAYTLLLQQIQGLCFSLMTFPPSYLQAALVHIQNEWWLCYIWWLLPQEQCSCDNYI